MVLKDKRKTILNKEQGFTLIEVLAAIVILSIVSLVLTSYFTQALSYSKSNQNKTIMVNLARNALFYMEKQDFEKTVDFFVTKKISLSAEKCQIGLCGNAGGTEGAAYRNAFDTVAMAHVLHPNINGIEYSIDVIYQQSLVKADVQDYLLPVKVVITRDSGGGPSTPVEVEGYISNEEIR